MTPPHELQAYRATGAIGRDDIAATTMLVEMALRDGAAEPDLLAWLGMCLALRTVRDGHTCVDFDRIIDWAGDLDDSRQANLAWPADAAAWISALQAAPALVGHPGELKRKPFLLDGHRLYLGRSHGEEQAIADALLDRAARGKLRILLGGPGTGKTTTVARELVARFQALPPGEPVPRMALAAPTGKAATRMTDAVKKACDAASGGEAVAAWITAAPARTIHKLLGFHPDRDERVSYHAKNPLPYDIVIVDEASMISSALMCLLLAAVHPEAELLLVGDPDQLASVDAGTVLGDVAAFGGPASASHLLQGCITTLEKIYRQDSQNIQGLGKAIRASDSAAAFTILTGNHGDVIWVDPDDASDLLMPEQFTHGVPSLRSGAFRPSALGSSSHTSIEAVTDIVVSHARHLQKLARSGDADAILTAKAALQVLCAHREGATGAAGWNTRIEKRLGVRAHDVWYVGRPVMVVRNTPSLRLSNGDVGVVVEAGSRREAIFGVPGHTISVPVARLEDVETVHAFTIHKSQGSEYDHVIVVLPERPSRIVTRELLYTGITRAKKKVTIIARRDVLTAAITTPIRRATGLGDRLA